jgi:Domain of unknown function (DUF4169)
MAELINLRTARKRAKRRLQDDDSHAQRLAHSVPKPTRKLEMARQEKASRDLDLHRIEPGDDR